MTVPGNKEPEDRGTSQADTPPGGGSRKGFGWVWGLLLVAVAIVLAVLLINNLR